MEFVIFERAIALFASIAGLIGAIYGGLKWLRNRKNVARIDLGNGGQAVRDPNRVVLNFDPKKVDVPGTFEHVIEGLKRRVHPEVRDLLLLNPKYLIETERFQERGGFYQGVFSAGMMLLALGALPFAVRQFLYDPSVNARLTEEPWMYLAMPVAYAVGLLFFGGTGWNSLTRSWAAKNTIAVAEAYLDYKQKHGISMGYEFTQAKAYHDKENSVAETQAA